MKMSSFEKRFVNSPGHSRTVARNADRLVRLAEPRAGQSYLDVGCGNGAAALHLAKTLALDVVGVDVDAEQVRAAGENVGGHAGARFEVQDATRLGFADASFDLVASYKTTHHIPDWPVAVAEMCRVLRPGGHLIYSDLICPDWIAATVGRLGLRSVGLPTARRLDEIFEEQGLRLVHRRRSSLHYEAVLLAVPERSVM